MSSTLSDDISSYPCGGAYGQVLASQGPDEIRDAMTLPFATQSPEMVNRRVLPPSISAFGSP